MAHFPDSQVGVVQSHRTRPSVAAARGDAIPGATEWPES